jgi:hypothetical protein
MTEVRISGQRIVMDLATKIMHCPQLFESRLLFALGLWLTRTIVLGGLVLEEKSYTCQGELHVCKVFFGYSLVLVWKTSSQSCMHKQV